MKTCLISLVLFCLISCEEDETYCFTCVESAAGVSSEFTRCGITEKESNDIERAGTEIDPESTHPYGVRLKKQTLCTKQ